MKDSNFIYSDLEDLLKTYSWLKFISNNPNTNEEMYSEIENMIYKMENIIFYYNNKNKISDKEFKKIVTKIKKQNYNYLELFLGE